MTTYTLSPYDRIAFIHAEAARLQLQIPAEDEYDEAFDDFVFSHLGVSSAELMRLVLAIDLVALTPVPASVITEVGRPVSADILLRMALMQFMRYSLRVSEKGGDLSSSDPSLADALLRPSSLNYGARPSMDEIAEGCEEDFSQWRLSLRTPPSAEDIHRHAEAIVEAWLPSPHTNPGAYLSLASEDDGMLVFPFAEEALEMRGGDDVTPIEILYAGAMSLLIARLTMPAE